MCMLLYSIFSSVKKLSSDISLKLADLMISWVSSGLYCKIIVQFGLGTTVSPITTAVKLK